MNASSEWFLLLILLVGVLSGATAAISGFGIGSLLTPFLAAALGTSTAVAVVSIPHAVATSIRAVRLRTAVDWGVIRRFGIISAVGGLAGAWLLTRLGGREVTIVLACLLLLTALAGLSGWTTRVRVPRAVVPILGLVSGLFGGVAGNQGGLRAAALTALHLPPRTFVATSTFIGVLVDAARTPVYLASAGDRLLSLALPIAAATAGVTIGTFLGERVLLGMSPERFRLVVSSMIGLLGVWLLTTL